jgi:DNA-binding MarR family transcriptional regulator
MTCDANTSDGFALEAFLPYRLSLLSNTVSQGISSAYRKPFGLSVTEWRVVAVLGRYPGLTASEIMRRTAMDKVAVSRAVKRLQDRGLVERGQHRQDRRRLPLSLTGDGGVPLFRSVVPLALEYENKLLAALSAAERDWIHRLLEKLQAAADSLNSAGGSEEPR